MGVDVGESRSVGRVNPRVSSIEFETFSVAVGLAAIVGGLALLAPFLSALTAALAALAMAGWASGLPRVRTGWAEWLPPTRRAGLLSVGLGVGAFFALSGPWAAVRGLALAVSLVPLWMVERRRGPAWNVRTGESP